MTLTKSMFGVLALVAFGATAAVADVTTVTCNDFMDMNTKSKLVAAKDMLAWINDSANSTAAGANLIGKYSSNSPTGEWQPLDFIIEIEGHCWDGDPSMSVIDRLNTHS